MIAIHMGRHTYNAAEPFTPWVQAIARYKLVDYLRRANGRLADAPIENAADVLAQDDFVGVESAYDLRRLLAGLPEKMRRAIEYVKIEGKSVSETAALCGSSESAVKVNVHRGLKALAAMIARERTT